MVASEVLGATTGGGPFAKVSADQKPLIGFRIQTADWFNRRCFRVFDPLFEKPEEAAPDGGTIVMARDGYAVGAITVNAAEFFNAVCITFMKKTDTGLDPKSFYVSPWYGQKIGLTQKKLTGNGQFIYGICGRKGLNVDAIGVVTAAPPADDGNK
jgi:hypothetical protein